MSAERVTAWLLVGLVLLTAANTLLMALFVAQGGAL
jgi:hypothetical protein